ncbi:sulfatase-like hydrolase/transferase [Carboxylicivirga sp. M1479]|nr:sulfatase-like hydrolase/transferase [Carboxylicivirga sp. M1479]
MSKKTFKHICLAAFLIMSCHKGATNNQLKPNVVLIYADDLGRGMLSYYGQKIVKTPNIDRLAYQGLVFENARGCMLCAPARASMLTGYHDCHPDKWKITKGGAYYAVSDSISDDLISNTIEKLVPEHKNIHHMAQVFKDVGYTTAQFGKLEWGFSVSKKQMDAHGWDHYCGYLDHMRAHGFYPPFLFEDGDIMPMSGNTRKDCGKTIEPETPESYKDRWDMTGKKLYSPNIILTKLLVFIQQNKNKPFFIYHPTTLPHGPVAVPEVHQDFIENDTLTEVEKEYASMVKMLDQHVGRILDELKQHRLLDNTLFIFTSDNGHELYYTMKGRCTKKGKNILTGVNYNNINTKYYSECGGDIFDGNDGMAGRKRDNWEGGSRVPLIMSWPAEIKGHREVSNLVANFDLITTFADMLHIQLQDPKDGISLWPVMNGTGPDTEHTYVVNASFQGASIVTNEGWKLRHYAPKNTFQLFYLPDDYREKHDLSHQHPERVILLKKQLLKECSGDYNNGLFSAKSNIIPVVVNP